MTLSKTIYVSVAVVLLVAAGLLLYLGTSPDTLRPTTPQLSSGKPSLLSSPFGITATISATKSTKPEHRIPLAKQIDALIATGKPKDAYAAYLLINDCVVFDELKTIPKLYSSKNEELTEQGKKDEAELCSGMTERIKTSRLDYLLVAAKAGVPGSAVSFMASGPFGDGTALTTRPDDLLVKEWKAQVVAFTDAAANNGEIGPLAFSASSYINGSEIYPRNPTLALEYGMAFHKINDQMGVPVSAFSDDLLKDIAANLTPEQIANATIGANTILETWKAHRNQ